MLILALKGSKLLPLIRKKKESYKPEGANPKYAKWKQSLGNDITFQSNPDPARDV